MFESVGGVMERAIAVWFVNETPVRLVWEGQRFRVNDTPTPLRPEDILWHPAITHPPKASWLGWRFQAVDEHGNAAVFDIRQFETGPHWQLVAVHDYLPQEQHAVNTEGEGERREVRAHLTHDTQEIRLDRLRVGVHGLH
jgi:hypothetical protein